ncbi:MAG: YfgM family protein [Cellvibrionaceae bacterium]
MAEHLSEEEQLEALKRWWSENGTSTVVGVVLAISGYLGWGFWQDKQQSDAEAASANYETLMEAVVAEPGQLLSEEQLTTANHLADELKAQHSSSLYASQAALFKAKLAVQSDDLSLAAAELQWVIERNVEPALTLLTRSRLARVQMDLGEYDQALTTVQDAKSGSFKAMFAEIRGDIFLAQGQSSQARAAYQLALDNLITEQASRRPLLEIKIGDLKTAPITETTAVPAEEAPASDNNNNAGDNT